MWAGRKTKAATKRRNENEKVDCDYDVVCGCDAGGSGCSEGSEHHCAGGYDHYQKDDQEACEES
jgi:hypothetical protein